MDAAAQSGLADVLAGIVGHEHVLRDAASRERFSTDIAGPAEHVAELVIAPGSVGEIQGVVRAAAAAGRAIVPRGGGLSYTGGYAPTRERTILLDLRRLDRVIAVHSEDRCVVVEAGCTWASVNAALSAHGLRLASFGPLSGLTATIGGGLSQHAMFFGAGTAGLAGDAVLGLEVVLADGTLLGTGALARTDAPPFFRQIGPDLGGLFIGDAGAFGVKARAALRVVPAPAAVAFASFAFPTLGALCEAQLAVAALGLAAECYGFDEVANRHLRERGFGIAGSVAIATELARASHNPLDAARTLLRVGASRFMDDDAAVATLHVVVEAESETVVSARLARVRETVAGRGREVADTIPRVTRAKPFRRIRALLGPSGQNWLPVHGIVPATRAMEAIDAVARSLEAQAETFARHRIEVAILTTAGPGWMLIEPQFFWFDALNAFVRYAVLPEQRASFGDRAADPQARAAVVASRAALCRTLDQAGAVHIQPGKYYPLPLASEAAVMLRRMKTLLDPENRMNPGALGLT